MVDRKLAPNGSRLCVGVAQLITKLQNINKMTTKNETSKNDFNATSHKTDVIGSSIDWTKQHCGVIQGEYSDVIELMPDLKDLLETFPENPNDFIWDVKVHMLMPNQFPCIPNWHRDMIPRDENLKEDESKIDDTKPMYLWLSNAPLTVFKDEFGEDYLVEPQKWKRFTQRDWHCGQMATEFTWRGLIRACHKDLGISNKKVNNPFGNKNPLRRHCQVYLDANNFKW